jgi:hypothetical protein
MGVTVTPLTVSPAFLDGPAAAGAAVTLVSAAGLGVAAVWAAVAPARSEAASAKGKAALI